MSVIAHAHRILAAKARKDFDCFVEYVGRDDDGEPLDQRPLDRLTWTFVDECHADGFPACVMLPMGFGKTTQFCYRAAWEIGRDLNLLASVVTDSLDNSKERVELVRRILDRAEYRRVFPEVRVIAGKDERQRFTVERDGLSKDPTCSAAGVLTGTGTRTNFLLMDDVVTQRNALLEPLSRKRVLEAIRLTWMSRTKIDSRKTMRLAWIQTAYHMGDAATLLREDPDSGWRFLIVRAEAPYEELAWERWEHGACVMTGTVESPFSAEAVEERARRMGPTAAARGLGNRPVSGDEAVFREEFFSGPTPGVPDDYERLTLFADPAGDARKARAGDRDWCAVVVVGFHKIDRRWDVLCADRMRGAPSEQARFIAGRATTWGAPRVYQEAVKDEALIEVTQKALLELERPIPVEAVKPTTNKEVRISQALEPALAAGMLRVCGRKFHVLRSEALAFPAGAHDDVLDALAGAFAKASHAGPGRYRTSFAGLSPEQRQRQHHLDMRRRRQASRRGWRRRYETIWEDPVWENDATA